MLIVNKSVWNAVQFLRLGAISKTTELSQFISKANHSISKQSKPVPQPLMLKIFTTTTLSHHHCQPKLFLLVLVAQSSLNLWDPMNFAIPSGSSAHGILHARILEWVAISFSRGLNYLNILKTGLLDAILLSLSLTYPNKTIKANPSKRFEACHVTFFVRTFSHSPFCSE